MTDPARAIEGFFFRPVRATGFGVMRILWALTTFAFFLSQWKDIYEYYAIDGFVPLDLEHLAVRGHWRVSLLDMLPSHDGVLLLYLLLLGFTLLMAIGLWPRLTTIASVVLLYSFHERNPFVLGGGDTMMRLIGFILVLAPGLGALSLSRLMRQRAQWRKQQHTLPPLTQPIWPYRMLMWQVIVLYGTSLWFKLLGTMWLDGTAMAAAIHHPFFSRWPGAAMDRLVRLSPFVSRATVLWHAMWLLLLIPKPLRGLLTPPLLSRISLKRFLLLGGLLFHGSIFVLMDAGDFSLAMFTAYAGLLLDEDLEAIRSFWNRGWNGKVIVLFDGRCGLCLRSVFWIRLADWLQRVEPANFRSRADRDRYAADIGEEQLDKAMHIRYPDGRTLKGFDAFRSLCRHLPPFWILIPFLWLPGVAPIGRHVYARIAARRKRCTHEGCAL
jgi:predicted DCC family thiol-disulfide oxidoreductase YuxK